MIFLRLAFLLALLIIGVAGVLYFIKRDPRYLTFLYRVALYSLFLLAGIAVFYVVERLMT